MAIKMIAASLVISSCCLIANGIILRSMLKAVDPLISANLDPQTVIIDVDRRGWLSFYNVYVSQTTMNRLIETRFTQHPSAPIIICAERRTPFSAVLRVVESCHAIGATDISLAEQSGFDRYKVPAFNAKTIPPHIATNRISSVFLHQGYFELNGSRENVRDMAEIMRNNIKTQTGHWYKIVISDDAPAVTVTTLLHIFQAYDSTNLVWKSAQ